MQQQVTQELESLGNFHPRQWPNQHESTEREIPIFKHCKPKCAIQRLFLELNRQPEHFRPLKWRQGHQKHQLEAANFVVSEPADTTDATIVNKHWLEPQLESDALQSNRAPIGARGKDDDGPDISEDEHASLYRPSELIILDDSYV